MLACAFTGHRKIKQEHRKSIVGLLKRAVEYAYSRGCRVFYSGGAIGFDTLAAREVLRFRIDHPDVTLVLLLPCINQDEKWNAAERDSYEYILSAANEVKYISEEYSEGCMKQRNFALASSADILIAYLDRASSGSGQTVRMAGKMGKEVYNLYPSLEKISEG